MCKCLLCSRFFFICILLPTYFLTWCKCIEIYSINNKMNSKIFIINIYYL
nr:MAG TPA: hypothetical protein [Caudoviricetes sp.]